jgi:hypothetical protein
MIFLFATKVMQIVSIINMTAKNHTFIENTQKHTTFDMTNKPATYQSVIVTSLNMIF